MATIKEVAREAGVSVGTVSHVVSGAAAVSPDLRERVEQAIRKLDYHPNYVARSLKVKTTELLGMVISDISNPFFPQLVRGAEDAAIEKGYLLVTFNTDDQASREAHILSVLRSRRVDGIMLVVAPNQGGLDHLRNTIQAGIPIVCLDRIPPGIAVDSVSVNNRRGAYLCVRHLIEAGHRRIAILTGAPGLQTAQDRLRGYLDALEEAALPADPGLCLEGDFRDQSGYRLGKELLARQPRPEAVFASNGMMALGLLQALEEAGLRCPQDLAVATFDDLRVSDVFRPHLTCVAQPAYQMGYQGAQLLIRRLRGEAASPDPVTIVLEPELKIRESSR